MAVNKSLCFHQVITCILLEFNKPCQACQRNPAWVNFTLHHFKNAALTVYNCCFSIGVKQAANKVVSLLWKSYIFNAILRSFLKCILKINSLFNMYEPKPVSRKKM